MHKSFEKILEMLSNIHRVVKTDEDAEWNRAIYKSTEIVKEVAEEYNGGWIACSERLPSGLDFVLYTHKDGDVDTCSIEYFYDYLDRITAWQPLPEPFKEREANG